MAAPRLLTRTGLLPERTNFITRTAAPCKRPQRGAAAQAPWLTCPWLTCFTHPHGGRRGSATPAAAAAGQPAATQM